MKSRMTVLAVAAALAASAAVGCGINRRYANGVIQQLPHEEVAVAYTWIDSSDSAFRQNSLPPAGSGQRRLTVTYPHPNTKYGRKFADVALEISPDTASDSADSAVAQLVTNPFRQQDQSKSGGSASDPNKLHLLLNREELEFLLRDLVADGYFEMGQRKQPKDGVEIDVTLGSRSTSKSWDHIAAFDQLAERVKSESVMQAKKSKRPGMLAAPAVSLVAPTAADFEEEPSATTSLDAQSGTAQF